MSECIENAVAYTFKVGLRPVMFRMWAFKNKIDFRLLILRSTSIEYHQITRKTAQYFIFCIFGDSLKKQAVGYCIELYNPVELMSRKSTFTNQS